MGDADGDMSSPVRLFELCVEMISASLTDEPPVEPVRRDPVRFSIKRRGLGGLFWLSARACLGAWKGIAVLLSFGLSMEN